MFVVSKHSPPDDKISPLDRPRQGSAHLNGLACLLRVRQAIEGEKTMARWRAAFVAGGKFLHCPTIAKEMKKSTRCIRSTRKGRTAAPTLFFPSS